MKKQAFTQKSPLLFRSWTALLEPFSTTSKRK